MNSLLIGNLIISSPTVLAPMEGVNCKAFRMLCKEMGAGLIFSAQIDTDIFFKRSKDIYLDIDKSEHPIALQISGSNKENLERTAKFIEPYCDLIDLNLGCGEDDIIQKEAGAYYLKNPEKIRTNFQSLIKNSKVPVTAKIRLGWDINTSELTYKILQSIGIAAITIHGRTKVQKYGGKSDWEAIKRIKNMSKIPIIGSGDITKAGHAKYYLERNYCDAVMVGRRAKRYPGIFHEINQALNNQPVKNIPKKQLRLRFLELYEKQKRKTKNQKKDHIKWLT